MRRAIVLLVVLLVVLLAAGCSRSTPPPTDDAIFTWMVDHGYTCKDVAGSVDSRACRAGDKYAGVNVSTAEGKIKLMTGGLTSGLMGTDQDATIRKLGDDFGWSDDTSEQILQEGLGGSSADGYVEWTWDRPDVQMDPISVTITVDPSAKTSH